MKYDPHIHRRRSIRLHGYDYSQAGAYFVTIVTQNRACLFGTITNGEMHLMDAGQMLQAQWDALPGRFPNIELDELTIMPNHVHGIIVLTDKTRVAVGAVPCARPVPDTTITTYARETAARVGHNPTLGNIVGAWKSITTDEYICAAHQSNWPPFEGKLWQRGYWEHILRDDDDLNRIREYILNNPLNWQSDENHPCNFKHQELRQG